MSISLQKGQKVNLSKEHAGLSRVVIGLGWDEVQTGRGGLFGRKPKPIDCDASALLLTNGKIAGKEDVVFFGNLRQNLHLTPARPPESSASGNHTVSSLDALPLFACGFFPLPVNANRGGNVPL